MKRNILTGIENYYYLNSRVGTGEQINLTGVHSLVIESIALNSYGFTVTKSILPRVIKLGYGIKSLNSYVLFGERNIFTVVENLVIEQNFATHSSTGEKKYF